MAHLHWGRVDKLSPGGSLTSRHMRVAILSHDPTLRFQPLRTLESKQGLRTISWRVMQPLYS